MHDTLYIILTSDERSEMLSCLVIVFAWCEVRATRNMLFPFFFSFLSVVVSDAANCKQDAEVCRDALVDA